MKNLTLKNMAQACNGTLVLPEGMRSEELEHRETTSVVIDSRKVTKDGMFVAVKGEKEKKFTRLSLTGWISIGIQ